MTNHTTPATNAGELFDRHQARLRGHVRATVDTSIANVDDAVSHAWAQLLGQHVAIEHPYAWLLTVAIRQAVKLEHRSRRITPFAESEDGELLEPVDPRDQITTLEDLLDIGSVLRAAGLLARYKGQAAAFVGATVYTSPPTSERSRPSTPTAAASRSPARSRSRSGGSPAQSSPAPRTTTNRRRGHVHVRACRRHERRAVGVGATRGDAAERSQIEAAGDARADPSGLSHPWRGALGEGIGPAPGGTRTPTGGRSR